MDSHYPKQSSEFFEAVGRALAAWQAVEVQLPLLYSLIIEAKHAPAAWASFRTIANLNTRLQVIEEAAKARTSPHLDAVVMLCGKLRVASEGRNRLAHYMYNAVVDESGRVDIFLANSRKNPALPSSTAVRIDDLRKWQEEWAALLLELTDAVVLVIGQSGSSSVPNPPVQPTGSAGG